MEENSRDLSRKTKVQGLGLAAVAVLNTAKHIPIAAATIKAM